MQIKVEFSLLNIVSMYLELKEFNATLTFDITAMASMLGLETSTMPHEIIRHHYY